ncbi:hypothetical protein [Marinobacter sp. KMM 10035]
MSMAAGTLTAMAIGITGGALLTTWCLWSRYQEIKEMRYDNQQQDEEK